MKLVIDEDRCEGHGKCVKAAPELFSFPEDSDYGVVLVDEVPEELKAKAEQAIRLCPRQAISWVKG